MECSSKRCLFRRPRKIREIWDSIPFSSLVLALKMPVYIPEVSKLNGLPVNYEEQSGLTSLVVTPLTANGKIIGADLMDNGGDYLEPSGKVFQECLWFGSYVGKLIDYMERQTKATAEMDKRPLSPRELEVMQQAVLGDSTKEIASRLRLSDYI
jgi:hypothetical protein